MSNKLDYIDSDNEFYDACESMEHKLAAYTLTDEVSSNNNNTTTEEISMPEPGNENYSKIETYNSDDENFDGGNEEDNFMTMNSDFKNIESKEFLSRHQLFYTPGSRIHKSYDAASESFFGSF